MTAALLAGPHLIRAAGRRRHEDPAAHPTAVVVPLLTAEYAAAGLLVTLLIGYPATWSVASPC